MSWILRGKIGIAGYGETGVNRDKKGLLSIEEYYAQAAQLAMKSAGLSKDDFDEQGIGLLEPQAVHPMWSAQLIQDLDFRPRVLIRSDHGGVGAGHLLEQAASAIHAGLVERVLCVAADAPLTYLTQTLTQRMVMDFIKPFGMMGPNSLFALIAQRYIEQYGIRIEQVAKVAMTQRLHAARNPIAYLKKEMSFQDYSNSRMISDPLRILDCCIPVNGGLAFIVASAQSLRGMTDKPVYLLGSGACYNYRHGSRTAQDITYTGIAKAAEEAFEKAEIRKETDTSFVQVYDDYTYAVLMQLEDLGYCKKGEGGSFVEARDISWDGDFPLNTGGGQLSSGQAGMAGSFLPLVEAVRQLREEGGDRQVRDAKIGVISLVGAITQYAGNFINCHVCVLGKEEPKG